MANKNPVQSVSAETLHKYRQNENMSRPGLRPLMAKRPGLYSATRGNKLMARRVSRLAARVWEVCPYLQPTDQPVVRAWASIEIVSSEILSAIFREGVILADGRANWLLTEYRQQKQYQLKLEQELGLTPSSRVSLGVDVARGRAIDLAAEIVEARQTGGK